MEFLVYLVFLVLLSVGGVLLFRAFVRPEKRTKVGLVIFGATILAPCVWAVLTEGMEKTLKPTCRRKETIELTIL